MERKDKQETKTHFAKKIGKLQKTKKKTTAKRERMKKYTKEQMNGNTRARTRTYTHTQYQSVSGGYCQTQFDRVEFWCAGGE